MSCSIRISVIAGSSASSNSVSFTRSARERPAAGSSSIISFGFDARAMPTSSWRCSPWESSITSASSLSARPIAPAISRPARRISSSRAFWIIRRWPSPTPSTARYRLSSTESPPNRREVWKVRESPSRARLRAGSAVTSPPNSSMLPVDGGNSPEIRLNSVVFPAPFGPRMARRSPGRTSRSTSATATTPPNRRPTPRKRRIGSARSTDGAGSAMCCLLAPEVHGLGVADPRRRGALLALRVVAIRRRRVGAEHAVERLVDVGDPADGLDVRHAVARLVRDDLLHEHVGDRLAVLVERHVAPRGLVARERQPGQRLLQRGLVLDVALDLLEPLEHGGHAGVVAVREDRRTRAGDLVAVVGLEVLDVGLHCGLVGVGRGHGPGHAADQVLADLLEDERVVPEDVAHHLLRVDLAALLLVLLEEVDQARAADADVEPVDVLRDLRDVGRVVLLAERRPDALGDVAADRAVLGHEP